MFTRTSSTLFLALALAACGGASPKDEAKLPAASSLAEAEKAAADAAADNGLISCAVGGATVFAARCQVETAQTKNGLVLTLRHPDGGFRRLLVVKDGRGVIAADGADPAIVKPIANNLIEVTLAGDTYRLPATVKGTAKP
ncbi:MAG: hypothetical protein ACKOPR_11320 [Chakrabartia godavariana]